MVVDLTPRKLSRQLLSLLVWSSAEGAFCGARAVQARSRTQDNLRKLGKLTHDIMERLLTQIEGKQQQPGTLEGMEAGRAYGQLDGRASGWWMGANVNQLCWPAGTRRLGWPQAVTKRMQATHRVGGSSSLIPPSSTGVQAWLGTLTSQTQPWPSPPASSMSGGLTILYPCASLPSAPQRPAPSLCITLGPASPSRLALPRSLLHLVPVEWDVYQHAAQHSFHKESFELIMYISRAYLSSTAPLLFEAHSGGKLSLRGVQQHARVLRAAAECLEDALTQLAGCLDGSVEYGRWVTEQHRRPACATLHFAAEHDADAVLCPCPCRMPLPYAVQRPACPAAAGAPVAVTG